MTYHALNTSSLSVNVNRILFSLQLEKAAEQEQLLEQSSKDMVVQQQRREALEQELEEQDVSIESGTRYMMKKVWNDFR